MSLAADTREAVRDRPFLLEALRAGVVNYAAAARTLPVSDDTDAVAAALRRFADDLPPREAESRTVRVRMRRDLEPAEDAAVSAADEDAFLSVGGEGFAPGEGSHTAILATGEVGARALAHVLSLLSAHGIDATAAGVAGGALLVVVDGRDGASALRFVEDGLASVPG